MNTPTRSSRAALTSSVKAAVTKLPWFVIQHLRVLELRLRRDIPLGLDGVRGAAELQGLAAKISDASENAFLTAGSANGSRG